MDQEDKVVEEHHERLRGGQGKVTFEAGNDATAGKWQPWRVRRQTQASSQSPPVEPVPQVGWGSGSVGLTKWRPIQCSASKQPTGNLTTAHVDQSELSSVPFESSSHFQAGFCHKETELFQGMWSCHQLTNNLKTRLGSRRQEVPCRLFIQELRWTWRNDILKYSETH